MKQRRNRLTLLIIAISSSLSVTEAVKFPFQNGIQVDGGQLRVGESSLLTCNFIKWKQETISKVIWSLGYTQKPGVNTNFFVSNFETGEKEVPTSSYFSVDPSSSGEKEVSLMLNDNREDRVNICCKVVAVRDSGYGMLKRDEREKCVPFPVVTGSRIDPQINFYVQRSQLRVGDPLHYECQLEEGGDTTQLVIFMNGNEIDRSRRYERNIRSNITVQEHHFRQSTSGSLTIECSAVMNGRVVAKEEYKVNRDNTPVQSTRRPFTNQQPRKARFYADPQFHGNHGKIPCHSYILVEDGSLTQDKKTIITGSIPSNILEYIPNVRTIGNRHESAEEAIQILNVLGYNGYRVVGMGNNLNRLTWTLEREYFEFHQNDDIHH